MDCFFVSVATRDDTTSTAWHDNMAWELQGDREIARWIRWAKISDKMDQVEKAAVKALQRCFLRLPKLEILLFQMRCGQIGLMWVGYGWMGWTCMESMIHDDSQVARIACPAGNDLLICPPWMNISCNFDQVPAAVVSGLGPSSEICSAKLGNTTGNLMGVAELVEGLSKSRVRWCVSLIFFQDLMLIWGSTNFAEVFDFPRAY